PQETRIGFGNDGVIHDQIPTSHREQEAQGQVEKYVPRPRPLEHTDQAIVEDAVKRVSYSRTGRHVAQIQQRHEVYPQWLRHRVLPPQGDSMPVFMRASTSAYLLSSARRTRRMSSRCTGIRCAMLGSCRAMCSSSSAAPIPAMVISSSPRSTVHGP